LSSNIEIKARADDYARKLFLAQRLAKEPPTVLVQEDVFFPVPVGRLKLRIFSPQKGELIFYQRPDIAGIKQSNYVISAIDDPLKLRSMLSSALGTTTIVKKKRLLWLVGQTRIHLDDVEGLGFFVELEVVMKPGQPPEEGQRIAQDLMQKLEIEDSHLIAGAYADLIQAQKQ
jgi:predicted adenylyl cyclase CyaB